MYRFACCERVFTLTETDTFDDVHLEGNWFSCKREQVSWKSVCRQALVEQPDNFHVVSGVRSNTTQFTISGLSLGRVTLKVPYLCNCHNARTCAGCRTNERIAIRGCTSYMSLCVKANCSAPSGGDDQHYLSSFIQYTKMTFSVIFFHFILFFSQHTCSQSLLENNLCHIWQYNYIRYDT